VTAKIGQIDVERKQFAMVGDSTDSIARSAWGEKG